MFLDTSVKKSVKECTVFVQYNSDENLVVFAEHRQGLGANQDSDAEPNESKQPIRDRNCGIGKTKRACSRAAFESTLKKARILEMVYSGST